MSDFRQLKAVDFFCGAGGLSYGLSTAGIKVIAGIDIEEDCKDTYEANNSESSFIHSDIKDLTFKQLEELEVKRNDDSLIFAGCSPCQHWTQIQTDKEKSLDTKYLLEDFQKFVSYFMPGFVVVENVRGILTNKYESKLTGFLDFLQENDYGVDYNIIDARYYGVPQTRKRFLLIASRIDKEIKLPEADKENDFKVEDYIGVDNGFPSINAGHIDETDFLHQTASLSEKNVRRLRLTPHNGGTRLAWKDDPELQINTYKGKDNTYKDTYGRMFWGKPAPTITTKFHSISNGRFAHPNEDRGISLREGATLQTFPKNYVFKGSGTGSVARQIGNAVPPELARRIGDSMCIQSG
ncbi:DNA cytosine methyltransferase [Chloroflexota bacterium]